MAVFSWSFLLSCISMSNVEHTRRTSKKRPLKIIVAITLLLAIAVGAVAYGLWQHEQSRAAADLLNDKDYGLFGEADRALEIKSDIGRELEELTNQSADRSGLSFFPEFYAAGRVLALSQDSLEKSLEYYAVAESMLSEYDHRDEVAVRFYGDYVLAAGSANQVELARALTDRLLVAIDSSDLTEEEAQRQKDAARFYVDDYLVAPPAEGGV